MTQPGQPPTITIQQAMDLAIAHQSAGRLQDADIIAQKILSAQPNHIDALRMRGLFAIKTGRAPLAADYIRQVLAQKPLEAQYYCDLAWALAEAQETAQAMSMYRLAITMKPDLPEAHNGLGALLQQEGHYDQAISEYRTALAIRPNYGEAYYNLSGALRWKGKINESLDACRKTVELLPNDPSAKENLGVTLLLNGEFAEGWRLHESRIQMQQVLQMHKGRPEPMWNGSDPSGKRILVRCEQGLGDTVNFIRYVPLLAQMGAKVIVECQSELLKLVQGVEGIEELIPEGAALPQFDAYCLLLSLPHLMKTTLDTVPAHVPYFHVDPSRVRFWKQRMQAEAGDRMKIGLVWAGKAHPTRKRSIPLVSFDPLAQARRTWFFSLQKGGELEDQKTAGKMELPLTDWTSEFTDFAETAAFMESLDLIIAVDTAVAHVAGALGKPVWLLLTYLPDWRWMPNRSDSPWYPTMRLFRQYRPGDWSEILHTLTMELRNLTA